MILNSTRVMRRKFLYVCALQFLQDGDIMRRQTETIEGRDSMLRDEIKQQFRMTYYELQSYLLEKYGPAQYDYFANSECRSHNSKLSRTKEGLYCHHMDEDKGGNLSDSNSAKLQPFEWQRKERLVYCNILEHLILHIKIAVLRQKKMLRKPTALSDFFTTGGVFQICKEINGLFEQNEGLTGWRRACYEAVLDNYDDYILLLHGVLEYLDGCYFGERKPAFLKVGSVVRFSDVEAEILKITKKKDKLLLKYPSGEEKTYPVVWLSEQCSYADYVDIQKRKMASTYSGFSDIVYRDLQQCRNMETASELAELLKVDYRGYGFCQFAHVELTADFGAENADEYISKAFPLYGDRECCLNGKTVKFWKGPDISEEAKDLFHILRVETMFSLKKDGKSFVRYKEHDLLRGTGLSSRFSNENNFLYRHGIVLKTSDYYNMKTGKYYSQYRDADGQVVDAKVILTLAGEDYQRFQEQYDVRYLKILDGCYFIEG